MRHHRNEVLLKSFKNGFTLAEVLITLGVIGIVAALIMPWTINTIQKKVLKTQFQKAYSLFTNGLRLAQVRMDGPVECFYWSSTAERNDGGACVAECTSTNEYGSCKSYQCAGQEGSGLPADYNGAYGDCKTLDNELFNNVFKVVKFCDKNALANGCVTEKFRGADKVKLDLNPDSNPDPVGSFTDSNIKNVYPVAILNNGMIVVRYGALGSSPLYTFDINGEKGPNKWGYDIFTFQLKGSIKEKVPTPVGITYATEKGGTTTQQMILDMNKK